MSLDPREIFLASIQYDRKKKELIATHPWLSDDSETLLDSLEGCTDLREFIAEWARSAKHDEAQALGLDAEINKLKAKQFDLDQRALVKRQIAFRYMSDNDIRSIKAPDYTTSIRRVAPSVIVTNEHIVPEQYRKITWTLNRTAIKKELESGNDIPGAEMSNGSETLFITT